MRPFFFCHTYQSSLVQQILNHMNESAVYNEADLKPFQKRLAELRQIVQQDGEHAKNPKAVTKLLERQLNECGLYRIITSTAPRSHATSF